MVFPLVYVLLLKTMLPVAGIVLNVIAYRFACGIVVVVEVDVVADVVNAFAGVFCDRVFEELVSLEPEKLA